MRALREQLRRRDDEGFTIAEVLVALLIFALMSVGTIHATVTMLQITGDARNRQVAANIAAQEIDNVRSFSDVLEVVDNTVETVQNGTRFRMQRTSSWVTAGGGVTGDSCGSGGGNLRFKEVTVRVTWDGMRPTTPPVTSNTLLNPRSPVVDETRSTILVTVLGADGTGRAGVTVTATAPGAPTASATTDNQGCAYLLRVNPGHYTVRVSRASFVDQDQQPSPASSAYVEAGATASVQFQYDLRATFVTRYAPGYALAAPAVQVRTIANLPVTFANSYGSTVVVPPSATTAMTQQLGLHPFSSGYSVYAGACTSSNPEAWGGEVPEPVGTVGGETVEVPVPMGVVLVTTPSGAARELVATPAAPAALTVPGDPGCGNLPSGTSYTFGTASGYTLPANSTVAVALPYGSWQLRLGGTVVTAAQMTPIGIPAQTTVNPATNVVTFDPRLP
ncbi:MAG: carboxypeptidase regulatory-like domain-containing protein [Micrococcales bacterium]|nr:carboxypeptidase regulatory-like domain-containing protein [Micrococcales bacterium]